MAVSRQASITGNLQDDYDVTTTTIVGGAAVNTTVHHTDYSGLRAFADGGENQRFRGRLDRRSRAGIHAVGSVFMRGEWEYIKFVSVKDTAVT